MGYIIFFAIIIISLIAQLMVKVAFSKYSKVRNSRGITGAEAARMILDDAGLSYVQIERVSGELTDHFDPKANVIRLSDSVYDSDSVAAVGVAAHESGHAIQYDQEYTPMKIRGAVIPAASIGTQIVTPLVIAGIFFSFPVLIDIGIILFLAVVLFQLITLPVEFNASGRALNILRDSFILDTDEVKGARSVLTACAMTYVAALIVALLNLFRLLLIRGRRR